MGTGGPCGEPQHLSRLHRTLVSRVYDQPLESLLTDDAAGLVRELFDGLHTADEIVSRLPPVPMPMFRETWVQGFRSGQASWFLDALRENEAVKMGAEGAPSPVLRGLRRRRPSG